MNLLTSTLKITYLFLLIAVCSFMPGYLIARKSQFSGLIKIIQSVSISILSVFFTSFAFYILRVNYLPYIIFSSSCILIAILLRKELFNLFMLPNVSLLMRHYMALLSWILILLLITKHYSGGKWTGDWVEHYQRALFFKNYWPLDTTFIELWKLPARPPLFNLLSSFYLTHVGDAFFYHQIIVSTLNSFVFFGAFSVLFLVFGKRIRRPLITISVLAVLFCLNPSIVQNITYVWTRSLTNCFILFALSFYFCAWKQNDHTLHGWAYLNLGIALLTHYSAAPYALCMALADLYFWLKGRFCPKHILTSWGIFLVIVSPWFFWSAYSYGVNVTLSSNSTFIELSKLGLSDNIARIVVNTYYSVVPHFLRPIPELRSGIEVEWLLVQTKEYVYRQDSLLAFIRDFTFMSYQVNLLMMIGSVSSLIVVVYLLKDFVAEFQRNKKGDLLILLFLILCIISGIAVHGGLDYYGLAHICLQPIAILGVVYLGANCHRYSPFIRNILCLGILVDYVVGILLHFAFQNLDFQAVMNINQKSAQLGVPLIRGTIHKVKSGCYFIGDGKYNMLVIIFLLCVLLMLIRSIQKKYKSATGSDVSDVLAIRPA